MDKRIANPSSSAYRRIEATFNPSRADDLRPEAEVLVGQRVVLQEGWVLDKEEGAPERYHGQTCWLPPITAGELDPFVGWIPDEDLSDVVEL